MSLTLSLQTALSALKYNQAALQVTANNVANANTEGYSRKITSPISQMIDGKGAGVLVSDITRQVNDNLIRDLRSQTSEFNRLDARLEFLKQVQGMFGSLASNSSLSANIANLSTKIEALATSPGDTSSQKSLITSAVALAQQFNDMSNNIQTLRTDTDQQITAAVATLNADLKNIQDLNVRIAKSVSLSESTAQLEDQRDIAIAKVAKQLDITTFGRSTGETVVMTRGGRVLVDTSAATLAHTPVSGLSAGITYPATINALTLDGIDITTEINGGRIAGLIDMRDTTLVKLQAEIDTLAGQLRTQVNAIHNDGVGFPAPNTLTGTRTVAGGDALAGPAGTVRIAVVDANGNAVAAPLDLALGALADVTAVVNAINGSGLGANITASLVGGKLVISADNAAHSVAINEGTSVLGGTGFSHFFGLNDFFIGDPSVSLARNIAVRADIVTNPQFLSRGELTEAALATGQAAITTGGNSVIQRLAGIFTSDITFTASGNLPPSTIKFSEYATLILSGSANDAAQVEEAKNFRKAVLDDVTFRAQSISGVNVDEEMANLVILQNAFAAASRVISVTSELMDVLLQLGR
jgi:flagellar hook-associated protein 1 FlgK